MMQYDVMVMNFCMESNLFQEDLMDKSYPNRDISAIPSPFLPAFPEAEASCIGCKGPGHYRPLDILLVDEIPNNHLGWG